MARVFKVACVCKGTGVRLPGLGWDCRHPTVDVHWGWTDVDHVENSPTSLNPHPTQVVGRCQSGQPGLGGG